MISDGGEVTITQVFKGADSYVPFKVGDVVGLHMDGRDRMVKILSVDRSATEIEVTWRTQAVVDDEGVVELPGNIGPRELDELVRRKAASACSETAEQIAGW